MYQTATFGALIQHLYTLTLFQLFYMAFLLVFTMALILPTCGNLYLDLIVFTWTGIIVVEVMRTTFVKKRVSVQ